MHHSTQARRLKLSDLDYKNEVNKLLLAIRALSTINIEFIISSIERADAIGAFVDPTAYRDMLYKKGNMHNIGKLAKLAEPLVAEFNKILEELEI